MKLSRRTVIWGSVALFALIVGSLHIDSARGYLVAVVVGIFFFAKRNLLSFIATFVLVKGKFIWTIFLKKLAVLSATGLGKRYITERVFLYHLQTHLIRPLGREIAYLMRYTTRNFRRLGIVKKLIALFTFLGSLSVVAKTMGVFLAIKVVLGKIWSFLLAFFIKISTAVVYFFTDYIWSSWITPIMEVLVFSWFFSLMQKMPFLGKWVKGLYRFVMRFFLFFEEILERFFHIPIKKLMRALVVKLRRAIRSFAAMRYESLHHRLKLSRTLAPNARQKVLIKRKMRKNDKERGYESAYFRLLNRKVK